MRNTLHYGTHEEFQKFLAINGYVPIKYKACNTGEFTEYFINEECSIVHVLPTRKKAKTPADVVWSIYVYNPNKSKNNANRHLVNIGFSAQLHRVVANTFLGNPNNEYTNQIRFKDGNYDNCKPSNLEWCSHGEAMRQYYSKKN